MKKNGIYGYWDTQKKQMVYIGQSDDIYRRHAAHMHSSQYNRQHINKVLQNNPDRYELVIIKARLGFSKEDRDILEKHYIEFYNTFNDKNKFNFTPGGDFAPSTVPEIAKKISESIKGKCTGENHPNYGKHFSLKKETKRKLSLSKGNRTGYFRVHLISCPRCKSGKRYRYQYFNDDGKRVAIYSVNLEKLKEKVLEKGLPWEKIN